MVSLGRKGINRASVRSRRISSWVSDARGTACGRYGAGASLDRIAQYMSHARCSLSMVSGISRKISKKAPFSEETAIRPSSRRSRFDGRWYRPRGAILQERHPIWPIFQPVWNPSGKDEVLPDSWTAYPATEEWLAREPRAPRRRGTPSRDSRVHQGHVRSAGPHRARRNWLVVRPPAMPVTNHDVGSTRDTTIEESSS